MAAFLELALALAPDLVDRLAPAPRKGRRASAPLLTAVKATVKIAAIAAILL